MRMPVLILCLPCRSLLVCNNVVGCAITLPPYNLVVGAIMWSQPHKEPQLEHQEDEGVRHEAQSKCELRNGQHADVPEVALARHIALNAGHLVD